MCAIIIIAYIISTYGIFLIFLTEIPLVILRHDIFWSNGKCQCFVWAKGKHQTVVVANDHSPLRSLRVRQMETPPCPLKRG